MTSPETKQLKKAWMLASKAEKKARAKAEKARSRLAAQNKEIMAEYQLVLNAERDAYYRYKNSERMDEEMDDPRICDECGATMTEGYCIDSGCEYYCSDECLHKHYTPEEWKSMYRDGDGDSYWTDWTEG
jgi:hypothetical protein